MADAVGLGVHIPRSKAISRVFSSHQALACGISHFDRLIFFATSLFTVIALFLQLNLSPNCGYSSSEPKMNDMLLVSRESFTILYFFLLKNSCTARRKKTFSVSKNCVVPKPKESISAVDVKYELVFKTLGFF